jgi:hypothetical protein
VAHSSSTADLAQIEIITMNSIFKTLFRSITKKNMCRDINMFYYHFNAETTKILEVYCMGYSFGDSTDKIAENIREYVNEKFTIWLQDELVSEFKIFCSTQHSSISAYIMRRLYNLLNTNNTQLIGKNSLLNLFLNISLMKNLATKIELELISRPALMYPAGVAKRANWNMVVPAFSSMHSFLAENFFVVRNDRQRIHGWKIFENKENMESLNNIFYPTSPTTCFVMDFVLKMIQNVSRSPEISKPPAAIFKNRRKIKNFTENATFAIYFET